MRTGAVIIAAGHKSTISRFQPMLPVGDSTVIRRIIITLKRAGIEPVVVVTGQKADEVEKSTKSRVARASMSWACASPLSWEA